MLTKYRVKYLTSSAEVSATPVILRGVHLHSTGTLATLTLQDGGSGATTDFSKMVSGSASGLEDFEALGGIQFETGMYATLSGGEAIIWYD